MSDLWDEEHDLVVVGSGAAGLTGAVTAATAGLSVLVVEKSGFWGGTSAFSGGGVWIPANPLMHAAGVDDSVGDALAYMDDIIGDAGPASSPERRLAFLRNGPEMVGFLAAEGFRWVRAERYPDYYPDRPGGKVGRSLEGAIVDGHRLGTWLATLRRQPGRPPLAFQTRDFDRLVMVARTPQGAVRAARVLGRTLAWRAARRDPLYAGTSLMGQLMMIAQQHGVIVRPKSPLSGLVVEDGRAAGIVVTRDGRQRRLRARRGVLLAAGGFARAADMRRRYQPVGDEWTTATKSDTGDAIVAAMEAGAATALMDEAWWGPSFVTPEGLRMFSVWERSLPGSIIVDQSGRRYVDESTSYLDVGRAMLERDRTVPAVPSWLVMDSRHRRRYPLVTMPPAMTPKSAVGSGFLVKARSLDELAGATDVDANGLRSTVARFNHFAATGVDEDFGRGRTAYDRYYSDPRVRPNPNLGPIDRPPYWAVRIYPGDLGTKGGLLTDEHGRVLGEDGEPIAGLYAAGNTTASVMGRTYPGPGATIAPAMVFAYIAARHAAAASRQPAPADAVQVSGRTVAPTGATPG